MDPRPRSTRPSRQFRRRFAPTPENPTPAPVRRLGWVPALDGLRGVAVLLVVLSHSFLVGVTTHIGVVDNLSRGGFLGVNIFFVLSGFLITALLLREQADRGHVRFGTFYAGRALRLLPALYVLLAAHVIYVAVTNPFPFENELVSVRAAVFYYYNWQVVWDLLKTVPDLGHLWSLSIEEQFYLVWPAVLILFLGLRHRAKTVAAVLIAVIVIIGVNRALLWQHTGWQALLNRTDTQADGLFVGALLAVLWVRRRAPTRGLIPVAWIALGVMVLSVEFVRGDGSFYFDGGSTLFAVAIAALILATLESNWPVNRLLCLAPLRAVGRVSYGLYLWHYPVFWVVARYGARWQFPCQPSSASPLREQPRCCRGCSWRAGIALEAPTAGRSTTQRTRLTTTTGRRPPCGRDASRSSTLACRGPDRSHGAVTDPTPKGATPWSRVADRSGGSPHDPVGFCLEALLERADRGRRALP